MSVHAADKVGSFRLSWGKCKKCKAVISQARLRLDNVVKAIVAAFDVYDGATVGLAVVLIFLCIAQ